MEPGLSSTLARSDCLADSHRDYTSHRDISSGNFRENVLFPVKVQVLIGLVARTKKISQLGTCSLRPGFSAWAVGTGPGLEVAAGIGARTAVFR